MTKSIFKTNPYLKDKKKYLEALKRNVESSSEISKGEIMDYVWTPFWFEGNLAWGYIDSLKDWERIKEEYKHEDLGTARINPLHSRPYFGFRSECCGEITLGKWAKENNMDIS